VPLDFLAALATLDPTVNLDCFHCGADATAHSRQIAHGFLRHQPNFRTFRKKTVLSFIESV
jgi:hypothetical protein